MVYDHDHLCVDMVSMISITYECVAQVCSHFGSSFGSKFCRGRSSKVGMGIPVASTVLAVLCGVQAHLHGHFSFGGPDGVNTHDVDRSQVCEEVKVCEEVCNVTVTCPVGQSEEDAGSFGSLLGGVVVGVTVSFSSSLWYHGRRPRRAPGGPAAIRAA